MIIFPAIDLYEGKAVRLYKGDYDKLTVYSNDPGEIGVKFKEAGASWIHIVDLEGARDGTTPNLDTILDIRSRSGLKCEVGGGIRTMDVIDRYLQNGIDRVILGTAALKDEELLKAAVAKYGERIAAGADIKDGKIAIKGWLETSDTDVYRFFERMQEIGISTVICTDISKDGAMMGTNRALYEELQAKYDICITASGGVSSIEDVRFLNTLGIYGCIIGKAYYTGAIDLKDAVDITK